MKILGKETIMDLRELRKSFTEEEIIETGLLSYLSNFPFYRGFLERRLQTILGELPKERDIRVLDFGCGTGILTKELKSRYSRVVGVDVDTRIAREYLSLSNITGVELIDNKGSSGLTGLQGREFDAVICAQVLEHLNLDECQL